MSEVRVTIEYFAQARAAAGGQGRETLSVTAATPICEVIRRVADKHGPRLSSLLLNPDGTLSHSTVVAVDGVQVSPGQDLTLHGGETVTIIPPISGGQP